MTVWASYVSGSFDKHNTDFALAERVGQGEWVGVVLLAFLGLPRKTTSHVQGVLFHGNEWVWLQSEMCTVNIACLSWAFAHNCRDLHMVTI